MTMDIQHTQPKRAAMEVVGRHRELLAMAAARRTLKRQAARDGERLDVDLVIEGVVDEDEGGCTHSLAA